jgi:hypothetical protein
MHARLIVMVFSMVGRWGSTASRGSRLAVQRRIALAASDIETR